MDWCDVRRAYRCILHCHTMSWDHCGCNVLQGLSCSTTRNWLQRPHKVIRCVQGCLALQRGMASLGHQVLCGLSYSKWDSIFFRFLIGRRVLRGHKVCSGLSGPTTWNGFVRSSVPLWVVIFLVGQYFLQVFNRSPRPWRSSGLFRVAVSYNQEWFLYVIELFLCCRVLRGLVGSLWVALF